MATGIKPAVVLVHGVWHTPDHYFDLICNFETADFDDDCPLFTCCDDTRRAGVGLYVDADFILQRSKTQESGLARRAWGQVQVPSSF